MTNPALRKCGSATCHIQQLQGQPISVGDLKVEQISEYSAELRASLKIHVPAQFVRESSMMACLFGSPDGHEGMMTASSQTQASLMRLKKADLVEEVLVLRRELDASREGEEPVDAAPVEALPGANLLAGDDRSGLWPVLEASPVGVSIIRPPRRSSLHQRCACGAGGRTATGRGGAGHPGPVLRSGGPRLLVWKRSSRWTANPWISCYLIS